MIPFGSLVILITPKKRRYIKRLVEGETWHTTDGALAYDEIARLDYGAVLYTSLGMPVRIEMPGLPDLLTGIKRKTQIIYPKEIAQICITLGAGPGRKIIEAGCGSGSLTLAFSWFCGPTGRVASHEAREEFINLARRNLTWAGLGENVEFYCRDIADGFVISDADALFLDVREPWLYLTHIPKALKKGAPCGFILPTTNQLSQLLAAMEGGPFGDIEICELLIRKWKPLADRLRPADRMVAHTGFLLFARCQPASPEFDNYLPPGTRERKQIQAAEERKLNNSSAT